MNMLQFGYRPQLRMPQPVLGQPQMMQGDAGFDGKMLRKAMARKTVDYNTSAMKYLEDRIWKRDYRDDRALQADPLYTQQLTLPQDMLDNPANCVTTKFIRAALNKDPRPVFCVCWTPDGRRLITGASSGEFTLWNGLTFNFETILQAHNSAVRAMIWSRNEQWMLTGDDKGYIKYWQANMNNVKMFQGHLEAIRGLSFAPTDCKFTSCSDDRTVRIFDFVTCTEETVLNGHGSDVKCVDWHPFKALIVSGSKDSQQPIILWDPRISGSKKITTLHAHKNTCTDLKWNQFNGNWLISSSRDHLCKLFDIRNLKEEVQSFRGHKKDACTVAWHPVYERFFASGGADGSIFFWQAGAEKELGAMEDAHESIVWDLSWHPLGHMLVSGSNDRSTRFWTRNRPGDTIIDKADEISMPKAERVTGIIFKTIEIPEMDQQKEGLICLPGLGLEKDMIEAGENEDENELSPKSHSRQMNFQHLNNMNHQNQFQNLNSAHLQIKKENQAYGLEDDDNMKKKAPYSKPIPKEFEKAWKSNKTVNQTSQPLHGSSGGGNNMMPPPSNAPNLMNLPQQTPPSLLQINTNESKSQDNKQQTNMTKSTSQPIRLMDLMATTLEPVVSKQQNNFKRKLSQDNSISPSNQTDQDTDDRQWQPNKNRPFYQNKNNSNNKNYNDNMSQDYEDNYEDNENGNNNYNNNSNQYNNSNYNQNRRGVNNNNSNRRGGFAGNNNTYNNNNNNKKFNDSNPDDENWQSDDNNDNEGYDEYNNGNNQNNFNNNRNRGNNNMRNNRNNTRGGFNNNTNNSNKNWSNNNNNYNNDDDNDVNNSNDNYDNNYENNANNNRLKNNNRRGGFNNSNNNNNNQRRGYYNNNMVSDNNS